MKDRKSEPASPLSSGAPVLFATESRISATSAPGGNAGRNWLPWIVGAAVILLLAALAFVLDSGHGPAASASPAGTYAAHVILSNVHLTQTSNFAGDQLTCVEGIVLNHGDQTVTSVTVRVLFSTATGDPPQVEQLPLTLVLTRHPFVETEPVSAAPLMPDSAHDFRLTFANAPPDWDHQVPSVTIENLVLSNPPHLSISTDSR